MGTYFVRASPSSPILRAAAEHFSGRRNAPRPMPSSSASMPLCNQRRIDAGRRFGSTPSRPAAMAIMTRNRLSRHARDLDRDRLQPAPDHTASNCWRAGPRFRQGADGEGGNLSGRRAGRWSQGFGAEEDGGPGRLVPTMSQHENRRHAAGLACMHGAGHRCRPDAATHKLLTSVCLPHQGLYAR